MRIYLLNTSKPYDENEDSYAGDWFTCPVDYEEVRERLHMQEGDTYAIEDYELPFPIREDTPLWEINANCRMVQELEGTPLYDEMKAIQERWFSNFEDFLDHKDDIRFYDVENPEELARYLLVNESMYGGIPVEVQPHVDYRSFGRELEANDAFLFTDSGVFRYR